MDLLCVKDLSVKFKNKDSLVIDSLDFAIQPGQTVGLVGESGCGKTSLALSILRLLPNADIVQGSISFKGLDLLRLSEEDIRKIRGQDISMIFQEPMTSLNPVLTIGRQTAEPFWIHKKVSKAYAYTKAEKWLEKVKIARAYEIMKSYPHQLSGGMRQRVLIAIAMICGPSLLIADEPLSAIDASIQARILSIMIELKEEIKTAILFISHDLKTVAKAADITAVMYAGQIVEQGTSVELFKNPLHPYTKGLVKAVPDLKKKSRLSEIRGCPPSLDFKAKKGCLFAERCSYASTLCLNHVPELTKASDNRHVRCWLI